MNNNMTTTNLRKPIRKSTGNYREPGIYFLTCCSYETAPLFGNIRDGKLVLNLVGEIINRWWEKLPSKFSRVELGEFVIMPNHFHGIIIIQREEPRLLPYGITIEKFVGEDPRVLPPKVLPDIPKIMQWFKTMSTNEFLRYQKQSHEIDSPRLWQRSYYDHIIRNDVDYRRIAEYIQNNPEKWIADRFHR